MAVGFQPLLRIEMILVTGATGRIGRHVVKHLVAHDQEVNVLVRDKEKAESQLPERVNMFEGDLSDPGIIEKAIANTTSVMLLSPLNPLQTELQGNVVAAAQATGKPHIVKISGLCTSIDSSVDSGRWHAETEQQIQSSGLSYSFLRPLFFMQNLGFQLESAQKQGVIRAGVGDAKIAMIDAEDIAEVTARVLMQPERLMNQAATLTDATSVTYHDVAAFFSQVLGQEIRYEPQSMQQVEQALLKSSQPDWHIKILLQFNQAFHEGYGDAANQIAADLLGRAPSNLVDFLTREVTKSDKGDGQNPFPS